MATEQEINACLRSLHKDFDFLLDNNVISTELYDQLVQKIPRRYSANPAKAASVVVPAAQPAPAPSATSPRNSVSSLTSQFNNTALAPVRSNTSVKSPPPPPTPASPPPPPYGLAQAEVLYDYNSQDEGDLNIRVGQKITILEYVNNDWWRGQAPNGDQGIFPSNYVRKIEADSEKKDIVPAAQPGYPGQYGGYQYPAQNYQQPVTYQPQPQAAPVEQQPQPQKHNKLAEFGKNYGRTFVNATAWGGGMALGADVINSII